MNIELDPSSSFETPLKKYYHPKMMRVATFLGGPLVTGYFIAENYKAFKQPGKAGLSWFYSIMFCVVLLVVIVLISRLRIGGNNGDSFKYVIPLLYSWGAYGLINYLQGGLIEEHVNAGGESYGWGRAILVSIIGLVVFMIVICSVLIVLSNIFPTLLPD